MNRIYIFIITIVLIHSADVLGKQLVSDETILFQKKNTFIFELDNRIPVVFRRIEGSEIFQLTTAFAYGETQLKSEDQPKLGVLLSLMSRGSHTWPKEKLFSLLEKYASSISCAANIETSSCSLVTLDEQVDEILPVYSTILKDPDLDNKEGKLVLRQTIASVGSSSQNPETYSNEVVNSVFYGNAHPYWMPMQKKLDLLKSVNVQELRSVHQDFIEKSRKVIVVVSARQPEEVRKILNVHFASLLQGKSQIVPPSAPKFNSKKDISIAERDIPTAYIRAKFLLPGITSPDSIASGLMMRILSEQLEDEIRTKKSLSYSVYAQAVPLSMGIGVIHASTSRPQETLQAIISVIKKLQDVPLSHDELQRHKTVFATNYFLTLEEHSSLASALASNFLYFASSDRLYDLPRSLDRVSPTDIQRLAKHYLSDLRLGVVSREKSFKKTWAEKFLNNFRAH